MPYDVATGTGHLPSGMRRAPFCLSTLRAGHILPRPRFSVSELILRFDCSYGCSSTNGIRRDLSASLHLAFCTGACAVDHLQWSRYAQRCQSSTLALFLPCALFSFFQLDLPAHHTFARFLMFCCLLWKAFWSPIILRWHHRLQQRPATALPFRVFPKPVPRWCFTDFISFSSCHFFYSRFR